VNGTQLSFASSDAAGSIQIRSVAAQDCAAIGSFVAGLSPESRFYRFFTPASPLSSAVLRGMCGAARTTDALVATDGGVIVGHAMAADSIEPGGQRESDIGLVVSDSWQRRGIGSALLGCLAQRAAARGVRVLAMDVLPENRLMLGLISRTWPGAAYAFHPDAVSVRASLPVTPVAGTFCGFAFRAV
jgi:ribosomal protein S18 acetylase RimI-like enzyme